MENQLQVLPQEVAQIAENVSVEKRNEVQAVLNHVFRGVSKMREQLDTVTVTDPEYKVGMKMANTIRLSVRQVRLDAEKTFDAKRAEVQAQMLSYKTEDQLWLKAKQTMQILTKEIEDAARWKEETAKRFEAEQRELKIQQRISKVAQYAPEIDRWEYEDMNDETFIVFLAGIEKAYNDRIEAEQKAEQERIAREKAEAEERERIRIENEKLKAEAEAKERQLAEERAKLRAEQEAARIAAEKAAAEKAKMEAEIRAKQEAEERAKREEEARIEAERKAKEAAERKAKSAPDKMKLIWLADQIQGLNLPEMKTEDAKAILKDVAVLLGKVSNFIREKTEKL